MTPWLFWDGLAQWGFHSWLEWCPWTRAGKAKERCSHDHVVPNVAATWFRRLCIPGTSDMPSRMKKTVSWRLEPGCSDRFNLRGVHIPTRRSEDGLWAILEIRPALAIAGPGPLRLHVLWQYGGEGRLACPATHRPTNVSSSHRFQKKKLYQGFYLIFLKVM